MTAISTTDNSHDSASETDLALMQGTWTLVSAMEDGTPLSEDKVKQTTIVVKDDTFRFPALADDATSKAGTFTLDASKRPKQMDTMSEDKTVMLGIYEIDEDSYKVCFAPAGALRPREFASMPGTAQILQIWQRQKK
jgi:uncharacterized protein (TIGR03067 family)